MHRFRPSRGLAALVSLLAVTTLAAPARAATYQADIVTSINDPKGDVTDEDDRPMTEARADVTAASVEYRPGEIAFTLSVAQPTDPRTDANWADGDSFALWALDTNADQDPDYIVTLVSVSGLLVPGVVKPTNMDEVLCFGSGTFDGASYGAVISSGCVGNPATFGWGAGIYYMLADGTVAIDGAPDSDNFAGPITAPLPLDPTAGGYWLVGDDGGIFSFNALFAGSTGAIKLNKPIVGMAADPDKKGYWFVASDGGIFGFDAPFFGSTGAINLNKPIVGMAATPTGKGYWLVASDGGIFSFGDAGFHGSTGAINLNKPIVGMAATPTGKGYWLVASDGGIFSFGDAGFHGSTGAINLNKPIVGMAATPTGKGYWLVASDGGIFSFGDAKFWGSTGSMTLAQPIVGMASSGTGGGYWFVASDGGIFGFGDAKFYGAAVGSSFPVVGMAAAKDGQGYTIVRADGSVVNRGSAPLAGSLVGNNLGRPVVGVAASL